MSKGQESIGVIVLENRKHGEISAQCEDANKINQRTSEGYVPREALKFCGRHLIQEQNGEV